MSETLLDAKGLKCPLPVLRARKAIKDVAVGGVLRVLATDPQADQDIAHFCKVSGNQLVETTKDGDVFTFLIRRA